MLKRWIAAAIVLVTIGTQTDHVMGQGGDETTEMYATEAPLDMDEIMSTTIHPEVLRIQQDCPCLPINLCPQEVAAFVVDLDNKEVMRCVHGSVRCCGVSSRSFIGMFGDPESIITTESTTTEDWQNVSDSPADSREEQSIGIDGGTTESNIETTNGPGEHDAQPVTVTPTTNNLRDGKSDDLEIPVQVIYADNERNTGQLSDPTQTETELYVSQDNIIPKGTDDVLAISTQTSTTRNTQVLTTTTPTPTTEKTTTYKPGNYKVGATKRRNRFRPASAQMRTKTTEIEAEQPQAVSKSLTSPKSTARLDRYNDRVHTTTVQPQLQTDAPTHSLRRNLYSAKNRPNYLRKKQVNTQEIRDEIPVDITTTPAPTQTPTLDVIVNIPTPISTSRLVSHVDKQHQFMIQKVRFMLAQDTRRYPMVPVHSSFSTMAVATNIPSALKEPLVETAPEPQFVSTESPTTNKYGRRPIRGRQRFGFTRANESQTSITEKSVEQQQPTRKSYRPRKLGTITTTISPNGVNDLNEDLQSTPKQYMFQRRTRRTNDSDVEFPSVSEDAFSTWSLMFPPIFANTITTSEDPVSTGATPTTQAPPSFLQKLSSFLPNPFWSRAASVDDQIADGTNISQSTINTDSTDVNVVDNHSATNTESSPTQSFEQVLDPASIWTSDDSNDDAEQPIGRILAGHVEPEASEGSASNRVEMISDDLPNFSGIITLNQNLEPWQIIGPIPKFNPPNDAEHIEFELPLDTREVVLI